MKSSITQLNLIEPKKCIIEDLEIIAFENEEELNYYTIWHEALVDKKKGIADEESAACNNLAPTTSKRTSINNVSAANQAEHQQQINRSGVPSTRLNNKSSRSPKKQTKQPKLSKKAIRLLQKQQQQQQEAIEDSDSDQSSSFEQSNEESQNQLTATSNKNSHQIRSKALPRQVPANVDATNNQLVIHASTVLANIHLRQGSASLPNGLTILNSARYNTLPSNKQMMKYKLTKLYNKYRGRQMRRNYVIEKQRNAKIDAEVSKSYLNTWLAYTALQALQIPDNNMCQLSATTTNGGHKFLTTTMSQPNSMYPSTTIQSTSLPLQQPIISYSNQQPLQMPTTPLTNGIHTYGKKSKSTKKIKLSQQQQPQQILGQSNSKHPMHLVYIDPGNIITYSNRIYPQQIIEYRKKPPIQPSSATSKKSSAASYDVYEIMEVLANTNKTNVTITRNANRPSNQTSNSNPTSIYSHSVNANTPGIVSTQLHLQAKSYLDLMSKFYAEEAELLEKERQEMANEPSIEEQINRYLKI